MHVAYSAEIDVLNAFTSQNLTDPEITMIEGLIVSNDKNQYIPVLAKDIPTYANGDAVLRDDGKVDMTWHLREGVLWQDGQEFTSHDVCFTWNYIVNEPQVYNQDQYLNIESCKELTSTPCCSPGKRRTPRTTRYLRRCCRAPVRRHDSGADHQQ